MNVPDEDGEVNDRADAGFDARYEPRPNLTGLISVNPDFSQIENAVTDIDFSYNEKRLGDYRPFFQEGSRYFGGNEFVLFLQQPDSGPRPRHARFRPRRRHRFRRLRNGRRG